MHPVPASVVPIGIFDGVHRGHQRIIGRAEQIARARHLPVVVITFDPHPDEVIRPGSHPPLLSTPRRRAEPIPKPPTRVRRSAVR